jgi:hypothetical protein
MQCTMKLNLLSLIVTRNKRGNFIQIIESYSSSFEVSHEIMEKVKPRRFCSRRTATVMGVISPEERSGSVNVGNVENSPSKTVLSLLQ